MDFISKLFNSTQELLGSRHNVAGYYAWRLFVSVLFIIFSAYSLHAIVPATASVPIVSGCEDNYPPFCVVDKGGNADGFSVELLRAAAKAMGREVVFRVGVWNEVKGLLEEGKIEALPLVGRTPEREPYFDFTVPYLSMHGAIVVKDSTEGIHVLSDLVGRKVAVMKGDNADEFLRRQALELTIQTTETFEQALSEVSEGRQDAVVMQRLVALRLIKETGLTNLRIVPESIKGFRQDFSFAVREGNKDLLALLNEGLALVIADGTFDRLRAKWFASLELPEDRRIVFGGDDNFPPYEFLDEKGFPAGLNVDLTRAIAREAGLDIEIKLAPWSQTLQQLEKGEIDAVQGMFFSNERRQNLNFSSSHSSVQSVAVVRSSDGIPPVDVAGLTGKRLVAQRGDIMHEFLIANGLTSQLTTVPNQEDALRELVEGRSDCALVAKLPALHWIEKNAWKNLTVGQRPLLSPEYCYAVRFRQKALLARIGESLKIVEETGEYRRIKEKWLGVYGNSSYDFTFVYRAVSLLVLLFSAILLLSILWSRSLSRQVAMRTAELKDREAQFRALIEGAPDAILVQTDLHFCFLNSAACRLLGADSDSMLIGQPFRDHFATLCSRATGDSTFFVNTHEESVLSREEIVIRLDGSRVPVELSAVSFMYEGKDGTLIFLHDISKRKLFEEENLRQLDELQRWQAVTLGREERIHELKRQVNGLCHRLGEPTRFPSQDK